MGGKKVGVISLGCDKNRVDTEKMLYRIREGGHTVVQRLSDADIVVINTCAFLASAREESVDTVLSAYRETGGKPIIVTGCLPQKYVSELYPALTEAAVFLGTKDYDGILSAIETAAGGGRADGVAGARGGYAEKRVLTTPKHYAYLTAADGCDNRCSYCLIPSIRGRYTSYKTEDLVREAEGLVRGGAREIILVAQDLTRYGIDLYGEYALTRLLRELSAVDGLPDGALRLLYCYPELVTRELRTEIRENPKIIKYIDVPLQHVSTKILKAMRRRTNYEGAAGLLRSLREEVPGISVRSTFMTGFPGETEEDFGLLKEFLREYELDNAGFFAYSREKGTASYSMRGQVPESVKAERLEALNLLQQEIYKKKNAAAVGSVREVTVDGAGGGRYFGRTYGNAPAADRVVYFISKEKYAGGDRAGVRITGGGVYDLYGEDTAGK